MRKIQFGTCIANPRAEETLRFARSIAESRRDKYAWWEGNLDKRPGRPFRWGPPMRTAPEGAMAELQRAVLQKPAAGFLALIASAVGIVSEILWPAPPVPPIGPSRVSRITYPSDYFDIDER